MDVPSFGTMRTRYSFSWTDSFTRRLIRLFSICCFREYFITAISGIYTIVIINQDKHYLLEYYYTIYFYFPNYSLPR